MTLVWKPGYSFDSDASTYIDAVETADGQALETGVRVAINDFVLGCKQDEIWDAIKASCILAGARTLDGALVPLVGTAPTNVGDNFVDGDYNRETGLVGDGSTKYLNTGYSTYGQSDVHLGVYISSGLGLGAYMGLLDSGSNSGSMLVQHPQRLERASIIRSINTSSNVLGGASTSSTGFVGGSKTQAGLHTHRSGGSDLSRSESTTLTLSPWNHYVFARNLGDSPNYFAPSGHRFAFYSIGESLDLAALDTRVSNLITAIGAAIP